jgi:proteasome lid subunit RPN8/RPN11
MLNISKQIIDAMIDHTQQGLPEEVCGYLAGNDRQVTRHYKLTNIDHSPEHFSFDPAEQFQVVR